MSELTNKQTKKTFLSNGLQTGLKMIENVVNVKRKS